MDDETVEAVRDRRAGRTPRLVVGPEHEVVDEKLRAASEKIRQRGASFIGVESVGLFDPDPRQLLPPPRQLVAAPGELLLRLQQIEPCGQPLVTCPGLMCGHLFRHWFFSPVRRYVSSLRKISAGHCTVGVASMAGFR